MSSGVRRYRDLKARTVRLPSVRRNPPGWSNTRVSIKARGSPYTSQMKQPDPAGEPPKDWMGTKPEWSVFWGLQKNGLVEGIDFTYLARLPGVGAGYYSQVDFLMPYYFIGIEVQGKYWHYGQGTQKIMSDQMRVALFAGQGIEIIFIDEEDANSDPIYYVKEALRGIDHSHVTSMGKVQ